MVFRKTMFRKVTIIGVGLIGGSLGMAIKKRRVARQVVGYSQRHTSLVYAKKNGAIDVASHDINKAVQNADLVILATPVSTIIGLLPTIAKHLKRKCIVTDVGSTKSAIVEEAEKNLPSGVFIGSHPLAGSEKRGASNASPELFNRSLCIVTPAEKTSRYAKDRIQKFWGRLGAKVRTLDPREHDEILAYISHLPHLTVYALMGTIPAEYLRYATQGLKDTTRVASSSPQIWTDVCLANPKPVLKALDEMVKNLAVLRKAIVGKEDRTLMDFFKNAKEKRDGIS